MIDLVLPHPRHESLKRDRQGVPVQIESLDLDSSRPGHVSIEAGHGQAPLLVHGLIVGRRDDHWIDDPAVLVLHLPYEDPLENADLRSGQPHTRGRAHGLEHVVGKPAMNVSDLLDLPRALAQSGISERPNR